MVVDLWCGVALLAVVRGHRQGLGFKIGREETCSGYGAASGPETGLPDHVLPGHVATGR